MEVGKLEYLAKCLHVTKGEAAVTVHSCRDDVNPLTAVAGGNSAL